MSDTPGSVTGSPIVVGVDGSRAADHAALWALDEAVARELPLHLVAVAESAAAGERAHGALRAAAAAVTATGRPVTIQTTVAEGDPAAALLAASPPAAMICVGAVGPKHFEHRAGSTVTTLVASAHCPVAVVRGDRKHGWVVAELDETPDSAAVLTAAVEEARLRQAPLRVLGTWQSGGSGQPDGADTGRMVRSHLDRRLGIWRHRYPDLDVEPVAVQGSGMAWLSGNAASIQMMVIGARNIVAVTELLGPAGLAALPDTAVLILDRQRLL